MAALDVPVRWPKGPVPWLIVCTYVPLVILAFWPASRGVTVLDKLWTFAVGVWK